MVDYKNELTAEEFSIIKLITDLGLHKFNY